MWSKFCQIFNEPFKICQSRLKFYLSGEISPNLVTLKDTLRRQFLNGTPQGREREKFASQSWKKLKHFFGLSREQIGSNLVFFYRDMCGIWTIARTEFKVPMDRNVLRKKRSFTSANLSEWVLVCFISKKWQFLASFYLFSSFQCNCQYIDR